MVGTPRFIERLGGALSKICPGVKLDCAEQRIGILHCTIDGRRVSCSDYCAHRAGCNLLLALAQHEGTVWIKNGEGTFKYDEGKDIVFWSSVSGPIDECTNCGGAEDFEMNPVPLLAHELIHAYHDLVTGTYRDSATHLTEEGCTVCAENQIRNEMKTRGRCTYGGYCVPCGPAAYAEMTAKYAYDCRLLPTESRHPRCKCRPSVREMALRLFSSLIQRLRSLLSYLQPLIRLIKRPLVPPTRAPPSRDPLGGGFADLTPPERDRREPFEVALRMLAHGRDKWSHPRVDALFEDSTDALMLEVVPLAGGYRVLLIALEANSARVVTNIGMSGESDAPLARQGDLVEYAPLGGMSDNLPGVVQEAVFWDADDRAASVKRRIADGDAHFLRVKSGGRLKRVALQGFHFPPRTDPEQARPDDDVDAGRWDAVRRAREIAAELIADLSERVAVLRPAGIVREPPP